MKKINILVVLALLINNYAFSQVGIGNTNPQATLDITGQATNVSEADGLLAPRITRANLIAKTAYNTTDHPGTLVYVTDLSGTTNAATVNVTAEGYYYYDNAGVWQQVVTGNIYTLNGSLTGNRVVDMPNSTLSFTPSGTELQNQFSIDGTTFSVDALNNRVGIGTTTPATRLEVRAPGTTLPQIIVASATNSIGEDYGTLYRNTIAGAYFGYLGTVAATWGNNSAGIIAGTDKSFGIKINGNPQNTTASSNADPEFFIRGSGAAGLRGNIGIGTTLPSRRLQIVPGSGVLIGNTITTGNLYTGNADVGGIELVGEADGGYISAQRNGNLPSLHLTKRTGNSGDALAQFLLNGVSRGTISLTAGGVAYTTASDKRLKANIQETKSGLNTINEIKVYDYIYKSDKNHTTETGFLAQDLHEVFPQAVRVGGDDEKIDPWQVDYAKLTPLLVKAIQEQQTQIEILKAEIEALKKSNIVKQ